MGRERMSTIEEEDCGTDDPEDSGVNRQRQLLHQLRRRPRLLFDSNKEVHIINK